MMKLLYSLSLMIIIYTRVSELTSNGNGGSLTAFGGNIPVDQNPPNLDPICKNRDNTFSLEQTDGFYKKVTPDRVVILTPDLDLDDNSRYIDPCKDFFLEVVNLRLKGNIKWYGRNVYISAVNVTVVGPRATLDVSYQSLGQPSYDPGVPAAPGQTPGQAGSDGKNGGHGKMSGNATLFIGFLHGGLLKLVAKGGKGGRGQDGGDGHEGGPGIPRSKSDPEACCHGSSTQGGQGGKGGNAGKTGLSGDGGPGGVVTYLTINKTWEDMRNFKLNAIKLPSADSSGGIPGDSATPGNPGDGGPGGLGSPTDRYNAGHWYDHHWRCRGSLGPTGPKGPRGNLAPPTAKAKAGRIGKSIVKFGTLYEISEHISFEMLYITMREANKQYKNGNFAGARDVYLWIMNTMKHHIDKERTSYGKKAKAMLLQMANGLDYWGHALNNLPMNSYASIYNYLTSNIIPYVKDVEADYDLYFGKAKDQAKQQAIAKNSIQHNNFHLNVLQKQKQDLTVELSKIKSGLDQLIHHQTDAQQMAEGMVAVCRSAIERYLIHKKSAITFGEIFQIVKAGVKIFAAFETGGATLASGISDFLGAIKSFDNIHGDIFDDLKGIGTIVKKLWGVGNNVSNALAKDWKGFESNFNKIKDLIDKAGQENSAKFLASGEAFDKQFDQWLYLPECSEAKASFQKYLNMSQAVNDKILHHDAVVIKIHSIDSEITLLQAENAQIESTSVEKFDPTVIKYAILVGRTYINLKDSIVDQMKRIQDAYNYEFLERRAFSYDDSRVALLEAWLASNRITMLQRMEAIGNQAETFNIGSKPLENSLVLRRTDMPSEFGRLDKTGTMSFVITGAEDQLAPMAHVHMTDVRVWIPDIHVDNGRVRTWLKRYGSSKVYDQNGHPWTFTHGARTMLFDYSVHGMKSLSSKTGKERSNEYKRKVKYIQDTHIEIDEKNSDYVALSPIGPWQLSLSTRYNPGLNTTKVKEIYIQLSYSFLPCNQPECPLRTRRTILAEETNVTSNAKQVGGGTQVSSEAVSVLPTTLIVLGSLLLVVVIVSVILVKRRRKMTSLTDQEKQPLIST